MSIFGFYFVSQLLSEMGWPRKQGAFRGEAYDTALVDLTVAQAMDWGAGLGAGRPLLALQMISEMFRDRDWESEEAPKVKQFIGNLADQDTWSGASSPVDAVQPVQFAKHYGKSIKPEALQDASLRAAMEHHLLEALLWGLSNPDRFDAWYSSKHASQVSRLPEMIEAGLDVEHVPSLSEFLEYCEQIVRDYERAIGRLPPIPPRLLDDAKALGWKV